MRLFFPFVLIVYIATVAGFVFAVRPPDILFPSFVFFLAFCLLPCMCSFFLALPSYGQAMMQKVGRFIVATALFVAVWLIQLWLLVQYAVTQSSEHIEGLLSNFYVFSHVFLVRGFVVAVAVLSLIIVLSNIVVRRYAKV